MSPLGLPLSTVFGALLLAVGVVVLAVSGRYVLRATAVYRAPQVDRLAAATPGQWCRVAGTVTATAEPIVAPFSGVECVAVRYGVEERRLSFPYVVPWDVTVHEGRAAVPFAVETGAETVAVAEPARTVTLTEQVVATSGPGETPADRIRRFEEDREGLPATTVWRDPPSVLAPLFRALSLGRRRYTERRAAPGDDVTVVGRVTEDGVDPLVLSDRSVGRTLSRMAGTSLVGLAIGLVAVGLGLVLLLAA